MSTFKPVPWLKRLVAGFSARKYLFETGSVRMRVLVNKVTLIQVSLRFLRSSSVSILL